MVFRIQQLTHLVPVFFISYYDSYKLYELPYHLTQEVDNALIYDSVKYDYFVHNIKNSFGFLLKALNDSFVKKFRTDSILLRSYNGGNSLNGDILSRLKITNSIVLNADSEKLIYKYIVEDKMYDSVYLYYNKNLKDIELALSSYRDSVVNSKLYKVQFFIKKGKIASYILCLGSWHTKYLFYFFVSCATNRGRGL